MAQDTRKDPRAKVLSMTVRYKSATIDEFIEHHSHDVSRGGIFIKTPSPFPPGTLLKFEIRIQEEQSVLAGVGRVVWKREPAQASGEMPAGMGVKFIKIDDKSKALISRLVEGQGGKVSNFDAGRPADAPIAPGPSAAAAAATAAAQKRASTMLGLGGIGGSGRSEPTSEDVVAAAAAASGAAPSGVPRPGLSSKPGTLLGVQAPDVRPSADGAFFPKTNPQAEMPPPEERTVMKQAAELLQQALAEAGGSMDEIGTPTANEPSPEPKSEKPAGAIPKEASSTNGESARPIAAVVKEAPKTAKAEETPARREATTVNERTSSKPEPKPARPKPAIEKEAHAQPALSAAADRDEGGAGGKVLTLLLIAAALAVGGFLYLNRATTTSTPESTTQTAAPPPTPAPEATAAPAATSEVPPAVSATATGAPTASATASASAKAADTAKTAAAAPPKPPPAPKPAAPAPATGASPAPPAPKPPPAKKGADPYD